MTDDNASVNNDEDGRQSQHLWVRWATDTNKYYIIYYLLRCEGSLV
jgi:hypothetical protein